MAGRIPQQFIDDLVSRVDIVDVIDEMVPLKKAGREFQACCPFHSEKTPSFTVSPAKQFYHCFGCGAHGTVVGFLMDYARMDFVEAVRELAARAGLEVPLDEAPRNQGPDTAPLYAILEEAAEYYRRQLKDHPGAPRAVAYLKDRGLSGEVAGRFGMGYAPAGWDPLLKALGQGAQRQEQLLAAGLLVEKEPGRRYDRFRDRVMFPILDRRGRTVGFGGRVLDQGEPKYLNSPETPVFHKGRELYGLYQARTARRELDQVLVVEGYMDVVALAQFDILNAVATLGTAATGEHLEQIFRTAPRVVFCFDGDNAGRKAAWRALETSLAFMREGREARFMFLPEGEDPDSLVRQGGADAFLLRMRQAPPLSTFFFERLAADLDLTSLDGRARLVDLARPLLKRIPPGAFHQLMTQRLGELSHVQTPDLTTLLNEGEVRRTAPSARPGRSRSQPPSLMRRTISLLLHHPELAEQVPEPARLESLDMPGAQVLRAMLELLQGQANMSPGGVLEHFRETEVGKHLRKLAGQGTPEPPDMDPAREFLDAVERLLAQQEARRYEALKAKLNSATPAEMREYLALVKGSRGRGGEQG